MSSQQIRKILPSNPIDQLLYEKFTNKVRTGYVEVGDDNVCLPHNFENYEPILRKFPIRNDDVWVTGIAKSGTTWCHEMVWMLVNNFDYERAKESSALRCPLLEIPSLYDIDISKLTNNSSIPQDFKYEVYLNNLKSPRSIKTHLNWSLLPEEIRTGTKTPKIINIFRNPKDTCVSHFHMSTLTAGFTGTFEDFAQLYLNGRVPYAPFWKYALSFWNQRHRSNLLLIRYEDMKADLEGVIRKVANFIGREINQEQIDELQKHLSFNTMKKNSSVNYNDTKTVFKTELQLATAKGEFVRSGKVGDYHNHMSNELSQKFDEWTKKNIQGTDFPIEYVNL